MKLCEIKNYKNEQGFIEVSNFNYLPKQLNETGYYIKNWVVFEDGKVLIKRCSKGGFEHYGQLISNEILNSVDIKTAKYELATKNGDYEYLISYCFETENQKFINSNQLLKNEQQDTLVGTLDLIDHYIHDNKMADQLKIDRIKLFLNEVFTLNYDNKAENWGIIHSFGHYEMSPAFDKGGIFRLNWPVFNSGFDKNNLLSNANFYKFSTGIFSRKQTFEEIITDLEKIICHQLTEEFAISKYKDIIIEELEKYTTMDINSIITTVECEHDIEIPAIAKERCQQHFYNSQFIFKKLLDEYTNVSNRRR